MRFYAAHAESFLADELLADPSAVAASQAGSVWQPLGVVLAVMPWNYPLWQVIRFAAPALMAGNTGLLKHASNVPHSALYLDELFDKGGFPPGCFRTLLIGSAEVAAVIEDERVKAVTLTGSEPAGRSVASSAGREIKKAVLELGGSDPFIVMPSADLDAASTVAVKARVSNNGQSCIAGKRFIVHADVYDAFVRLFVDKMSALVVGDPMDEATDVGPLATESGRDEIAELVDDAVAKGAQVLTGGSAPQRPGWFYSPTVLAGLTEDMRVVMEETFGVEHRCAGTGLVHLSPRRRCGVPQRHDGVLPRAAVRRGKGVGLRARAGQRGHPGVLQPQDGVEGLKGLSHDTKQTGAASRRADLYVFSTRWRQTTPAPGTWSGSLDRRR
jgi:succinate-semialdehyde dehydrogenase/glutarate-semialdehyde dehydrogenase